MVPPSVAQRRRTIITIIIIIIIVITGIGINLQATSSRISEVMTSLVEL